MEPWFEMMITVVCSILASSGLWAFVMKIHDKKDAKTEVIIGLAHDRIMALGMYYIERGYITNDEYENLRGYLYDPYRKLGGNGSAKKIMDEVDRLPIRSRLEVNADETK